MSKTYTEEQVEKLLEKQQAKFELYLAQQLAQQRAYFEEQISELRQEIAQLRAECAQLREEIVRLNKKLSTRYIPKSCRIDHYLTSLTTIY